MNHTSVYAVEYERGTGIKARFVGSMHTPSAELKESCTPVANTLLG